MVRGHTTVLSGRSELGNFPRLVKFAFGTEGFGPNRAEMADLEVYRKTAGVLADIDMGVGVLQCSSANL